MPSLNHIHLSNKPLPASMDHTRVCPVLLKGSPKQTLSNISRAVLIKVLRPLILLQHRLGQPIMLNSNKGRAILNIQIAVLDRNSVRKRKPSINVNYVKGM